MSLNEKIGALKNKITIADNEYGSSIIWVKQSESCSW